MYKRCCWNSILVLVAGTPGVDYQAYGLRSPKVATFICRVIGNWYIIAHELMNANQFTELISSIRLVEENDIGGEEVVEQEQEEDTEFSRYAED